MIISDQNPRRNTPMFEASKRQTLSNSQSKFTHVDAILILFTKTLEEHVKYSVRRMRLEILTAVLQKIHVLREVAQWCWWAI
jgi:hypothetical protein